MSEQALKLIAENRRTKAPFLDLGNCGLTSLPSEIAESVWLESLALANEWYDWRSGDWHRNKTQNSGPPNRGPIDLDPLRSLPALQSLIAGAVSDLAPLAGLPSLRTLYVSGAQVSDLGPLAGLKWLQTLDISKTQVSDLGPLARLTSLENLFIYGTPVADLSPLVGLKSLQTLHCSGTQVSDLGPLAGMLSLRWLLVGGTQVSDLSSLSGISSLQLINLHGTPVSDIRPLAGLTSLRQIIASATRISDLRPLAGISSLQTVGIDRTAVSDLSRALPLLERGLPVKWNSHPWEGPGIYVENCPLTVPPPDIVRQGNAAILNYFREREREGVDHLYEAKLLILGEGGAGKTSLLRRLYEPGRPLPAEKETTKGISIHRHDFPLANGRTFRLNVWDFGGQEIYHSTHQFFLTERSLYILVDDTRKDAKSVSDESFKYWLDLVNAFGGHSPVLIYQNEKGGRTKAIDFPGIRARYDNVEKLYSGNLETPDSADTLREGIEFFAAHLTHIGQELPARWIQVRADIEARSAETPHITREEYFEIYCRHLEPDLTKAQYLSRYLHDLGVFLHFQDDYLLARTIILQNEWATEAVFRILDDEPVKAQFGRFNRADCERVWRDSKYSHMHPELLALMERFELCYVLRDKTPVTWLAPRLLPPGKPLALADWARPGDLVLRYRYEFLPKGTISRLIVRLNRFVRDAELAWVTGVLFQRESTEVHVELLPRGGEIELRARGPEAKALLSAVCSDLDALNDSFDGLRDKVDKRIPCICKICSAGPDVHFFENKALLRRKNDNRLKVECPISYEEVDVLELLDGIRMEAPPSWTDKEPPSAPRTIRIFLASSSELREDRDAFDLYFRQMNDRLLDERRIYLKIVRWENFLDAMSDTRLQDEYNKAIRNCDIFVALFATKTGKYTSEEFDVAHNQFKSAGKPLIFTWFKDAHITTGTANEDDLASLFAFRKKLKNLGHYHTTYDNIEHLKRQFRDQLDILTSKP